MDNKIKFYKTIDEYGCFSNFSHHEIFLDGMIWKTAEHYFQSRKFSDPAIIIKIQSAETANIAANIGRDKNLEIKKNWEDVKVEFMRKVILAKSEQHEDIRQKLIQTGNKEIIEDSPYDNYWGIGMDGTGLNMLGKIWMETREKLLKKDYSKYIEPPWIFHKGEDKKSIYWRMGDGEGFIIKWWNWFNGLNEKEQNEFKLKYPTPKNWENFYEE